jgi:hypothetical protein
MQKFFPKGPAKFVNFFSLERNFSKTFSQLKIQFLPEPLTKLIDHNAKSDFGPGKEDLAPGFGHFRLLPSWSMMMSRVQIRGTPRGWV